MVDEPVVDEPVGDNPVDAGRRRFLALVGAGTAALATGAVWAVRTLTGGADGSVASGTSTTTRRTGARATSSTGRSTTTQGRTAEPPEPEGPQPAPSYEEAPAGGAPPQIDSPPEPSPEESSAAVVLLCREAWRAAPPTHALPPHEVAGLLVHHTAVVHTDAREGPARMRSHQRYHQSRGFSDIAYHVVIDAGGHAYEGRTPSQPGETFTEYETRGWFLVTCEGNFDEQAVPDAQVETLCRMLAWASRRYGVGPEAVRTHRDVASTTCPGAALAARFADGSVARRVDELTAAGVELAMLCGPEGAERVAAIESGQA